MKLKQRQLFGRFDNFLIFSSFFLELRSKGLYPSSEQEKENHCLVFTLFTFFRKCEIRKFHVVVARRRQRIVPKNALHVHFFVVVARLRRCTNTTCYENMNSCRQYLLVRSLKVRYNGQQKTCNLSCDIAAKRAE